MKLNVRDKERGRNRDRARQREVGREEGGISVGFLEDKARRKGVMKDNEKESRKKE